MLISKQWVKLCSVNTSRKLPDDMKTEYTDLIQKMLTKTIYDRLDNNDEEPDVTYDC